MKKSISVLESHPPIGRSSIKEVQHLALMVLCLLIWRFGSASAQSPSAFSPPVMSFSTKSMCANQTLNFSASWAIQEDRFQGNGVNPFAHLIVNGIEYTSSSYGVRQTSGSYSPNGSGMLNAIESYETVPASSSWYTGPGNYTFIYELIVDRNLGAPRPYSSPVTVFVGEPVIVTEMSPNPDLTYRTGNGPMFIQLKGSNLLYQTEVLFDQRKLSLIYANGSLLQTETFTPTLGQHTVTVKSCDGNDIIRTLNVEPPLPSTFNAPVMNVSATSICSNQVLNYSATWSIQEDRFIGGAVNPRARLLVNGVPDGGVGVSLTSSSYTPSGGMVNAVESFTTTPANAGWYRGPGDYTFTYEMVVDGNLGIPRTFSSPFTVKVGELVSATQMSPTSYTVGSGNVQLRFSGGTGLGYGTKVLFDGQPLSIVSSNGGVIETDLVPSSLLTVDVPHTVSLPSCDGNNSIFSFTVQSPSPSVFTSPVLSIPVTSVCSAQSVNFSATWAIQADRFISGAVNPRGALFITDPSGFRRQYTGADGISQVSSSYSPSGGMTNATENYTTTPAGSSWYKGAGNYIFEYVTFVDENLGIPRTLSSSVTVKIGELVSASQMTLVGASQMTPAIYTLGTGNLQFTLSGGSGLGYGTTVLLDNQYPLSVSFANGNSLTTAVLTDETLLTGMEDHNVSITSCDGTVSRFWFKAVSPIPLAISSISPPTYSLGSGPLVLTITGAGITAQTEVLFDGEPIAIASRSATQIVTQEVPQGMLSLGQHNVKLRNGNKTTGDVPIIITAEVCFTASSVVPNHVRPFDPNFTNFPNPLIINGTGFTANISVTLRGRNTQTVCTIPASNIAILNGGTQIAISNIRQIPCIRSLPDTYTVDIRSASGNCSDNTLTYTVDPWIRNIQVTASGSAAICGTSNFNQRLTLVVDYQMAVPSLNPQLFIPSRNNPQAYIFVAGPYNSPNPPSPQYTRITAGLLPTPGNLIPGRNIPNPNYTSNPINATEAFTFDLNASAHWYNGPGCYLFQYRSLVDNIDNITNDPIIQLPNRRPGSYFIDAAPISVCIQNGMPQITARPDNCGQSLTVTTVGNGTFIYPMTLTITGRASGNTVSRMIMVPSGNSNDFTVALTPNLTADTYSISLANSACNPVSTTFSFTPIPTAIASVSEGSCGTNQYTVTGTGFFYPMNITITPMPQGTPIRLTIPAPAPNATTPNATQFVFTQALTAGNYRLDINASSLQCPANYTFPVRGTTFIGAVNQSGCQSEFTATGLNLLNPTSIEIYQNGMSVQTINVANITPTSTGFIFRPSPALTAGMYELRVSTNCGTATLVFNANSVNPSDVVVAPRAIALASAAAFTFAQQSQPGTSFSDFSGVTGVFLTDQMGRTFSVTGWEEFPKSNSNPKYLRFDLPKALVDILDVSVDNSFNLTIEKGCRQLQSSIFLQKPVKDGFSLCNQTTFGAVTRCDVPIVFKIIATPINSASFLNGVSPLTPENTQAWSEGARIQESNIDVQVWLVGKDGVTYSENDPRRLNLTIGKGFSSSPYIYESRGATRFDTPHYVYASRVEWKYDPNQDMSWLTSYGDYTFEYRYIHKLTGRPFHVCQQGLTIIIPPKIFSAKIKWDVVNKSARAYIEIEGEDLRSVANSTNRVNVSLDYRGWWPLATFYTLTNPGVRYISPDNKILRTEYIPENIRIITGLSITNNEQYNVVVEKAQNGWPVRRYLSVDPRPTTLAVAETISPSEITISVEPLLLANTNVLTKSTASLQSDTTVAPYTIITIRGQNFESGMGVLVNGKSVPTQYIDSVTAKIYLPKEYTSQPGILRFTVYGSTQKDPTGQVISVTLKVKAPVPVLTALSSPTTTATLDSRSWTMTVSGQNFFPGARVIYNGTTLATSAVKVESATSLRVVLPDVPITSAQYTLAVLNPSPTDSASNKLTLNVVYPQPVLHATAPVSPVTTTATLATWMLTLRGGNFSDQAVVRIDGQSVPFVYVNSTQLKVPMPETSAIAARTHRIVITNPTPGGGQTDTLTVNVIHPAPVLDSLSLTRTVAGSPVSIRLVGSRFAASAGVLLNGAALTSGVTVESPTSILVALTAAQVRTVGNYNFTVNNPALGGGNSSTRTLRVVPAFASTVEFSRVTTAIVAGNRLSNVTLRFRDESGNLTDFDGVLRFSNASGTSTGTLSLRRSSIGVSTATATRFNLADTYTLRVDSVPTATGKRDFEVVPATDFSVVVSGVPTAQVAGATLPAFTVLYFDRLGNATEDRLGEVRIRHDQKGYLHVLPRTQMDEGVYQTAPLQITTSGSYSVFVTGISVSNITGNRTVAITPATTVAAEFQYVDSSFSAGSRQTAFRVTYRDSFSNLAEGPTTITAYGVNTLGVAATGTSTASIALTKHATSLYYTAEATAFWIPGAYTMSMSGISQYVGQRTFTVTGLAAYSASVTGVPQERTAGSQLSGVTVRLTDRLGNPITGNIGTVALRHSRGFYHALASTSQANGVYSIAGMQLTTVGTYTLSIGGIVAANITGNPMVTVVQAPVTSAAFQYVDSSFNVGGKQTAFRVTYRDAFGNLLNGPDSVRAVSGNASSTSTITLTNISLGVYTATATAFSVPGAYTLSVAGVSEYTGQRTFTVNSIAASNALVTGLSSTLTAGAQTGTFTIRLTDAQNNPVSNSIGAVTLRHERGFTHLLAVTPQTNGVYSVQGIQATTVGTYTLSIGGIVATNITGNRVVAVAQGPVTSAEFLYVDSSFNVGGKQTAFRVTYRDAFGNLLNGPDSVRAVSGNGSSTSTITLTNISLGVYTATATAFSVPGAYTLSVAGVTTYNGQRTFTVNSIAASNALVTGVPATLTAGAQVGTFTIRLTDNVGNAVNGNIGAVTLRHERGFTHLLPTQAQANGVYSVQSAMVTTSGTYTVNIAGISTANITGNRAVMVTPSPVNNVTFQSVDTSITAGGNQVGFRVTYRDAFGNLADGSESATASNGGTSTASITLTRSSIGVYTATPTAFTRAGTYSLSIVGVQPLGVRTFTVLPAGAATVEVRGVQPSIARGAQQSGISLAIADRFGNATDRLTSILRFARTTSNPASTGTIVLTRTALGVMTAEATAFAVAGSYRLTVDGIAASALLGANTFTVTTAATVATLFKNGESILNTAQNNAETSVAAREEAVAGVMPLSVTTYPNPAVNDMELVVRLPREERVTITLRDNLGRVVAVVAETTMKSGENRLQYNLSTLPSGVYHCMVQSLSQRSMTQVIIAR